MNRIKLHPGLNMAFCMILKYVLNNTVNIDSDLNLMFPSTYRTQLMVEIYNSKILNQSINQNSFKIYVFTENVRNRISQSPQQSKSKEHE